ncbi:uncharacterized protein LOC106645347 [Copidosoma floridanum]|uniref:uncharacterized protein LOC106645347 n=1 Tax=Copidosoma floridanum TaxID=29053 RepID=UPI0006C9BA09|nr:uncharacterized protein LOC106645347 [Copidosoma floridanum]
MKGVQQLSNLCKADGMSLAKWHSNSPEFIYSIQSTSQPLSLDDCKAKILGLNRRPHQDSLLFNSELLTIPQQPTKRIILSEISQIFDPLEFISPVTILAKIIPQELWMLKVSWDEPIPESLSSRWLHIRSDVTLLDAIAIPRLELTAALILAKLTRYVVHQVKFTVSKIHLWTDSTVTLFWLRSHPSRWKDFMRNWVTQIIDLVPSAQWRHVPGKHNPVDCASKGLLTSQLVSHDLWWNGPVWMTSDDRGWPDQPDTFQFDDSSEARPTAVLVATSKPSDLSSQLLKFCSTLQHLYRLTTTVVLACEKFKAKLKSQTHSTSVTADLITQAKLFWIKSIQAVLQR